MKEPEINQLLSSMWLKFCFPLYSLSRPLWITAQIGENWTQFPLDQATQLTKSIFLSKTGFWIDLSQQSKEESQICAVTLWIFLSIITEDKGRNDCLWSGWNTESQNPKRERERKREIFHILVHIFKDWQMIFGEVLKTEQRWQKSIEWDKYHGELYGDKIQLLMEYLIPDKVDVLNKNVFGF